MAVIIVCLIIGLIPANIAKSKGYEFGKWYVYGIFLFIIALIHSLLLQDLKSPSRVWKSINEKPIVSGFYFCIVKNHEGFNKCYYSKEKNNWYWSDGCYDEVEVEKWS